MSRSSVELTNIAERAANHIRHEIESRYVRASNELRNASMLVLRGQRSGRRYKVPGTYRRQRDSVTGKMRNGRYYTASAPGEPPAVRTGTFRNSWQSKPHKEGPDVYVASIESTVRTDNGQYLLGEILEDGSPGGKIAPRPHHQRIQQKALPKIMRIFREPYF